MIIILKHIHAKTTKDDIVALIAPVIQGGFLQKSGKIEAVSILAQKNTLTNVVRYHALVKIQPDSVGQRVVSRLNGKVMRGKRIFVCEFQKRSWRNDPRLNKDNIFNKWLDNKRYAERRAQHIIISADESGLSPL